MSSIPSCKAICKIFARFQQESADANETSPGRTISPNIRPFRATKATTSPVRARTWMLALPALLLIASGAQAQAVFNPLAVGSSAEQTVTVVAPGGSTVASVVVLTMGVPNILDFQKGNGSSCVTTIPSAPNNSCQQSVSFTPTAPGLRLGAVVVFDSGGNVLGTTYISGTGSGGLGVFVSGNVLPVAGDGDYKDAVQDGIPATSAELASRWMAQATST